ncbi:MAG: histidine phosphatase family protein [Nocardioidaceae bacterium]
MSDLHCAATLLLARHGEAEYESALLSDAGGSLTLRGRDQSAALAEQLRDARVAAVYCSDLARAVQTAEIVAARLGVGVRVRAGLREWSVGAFAGREPAPGLFDPTLDAWAAGDLEARLPGAESSAEILDRVRGALEAIVDEHRGETVLVVGHGGVLPFVVPHLAGRPPGPGGRSFPHCGVAEVTADADGWLLKRWPASDLVEKPV